MNREQLKASASNRRTTEQVEVKTADWHCDYCDKNFVRESAFMRHFCKGKAKINELRSPIGQAAYSYYCTWMKVQRHTVPPIETFSNSTQYNAFIKFSEWAQRTNLPKVEDFIKFMVETDTRPPLWARDNAYALYIKRFDKLVTPERQFIESLECIKALAEDMKVKPVGKVFEALGVAELIALIRRRKLTFWFLLASRKFKDYLNSLPETDKTRLAEAFNIGAAVERIGQEEYRIREFREACKEEGL